jgi:hypothetical protein
MELSIIIVSWNVKEKLRANLRALFASVGAPRFEVFVVDNASADGSAAMVRQEFPQAKLIANDDNRGFAAANNQALRQASGRYVLLLNPDMEVFPDTISKSYDWLKINPQATIAGFKLLDEHDQVVPQIRRFPRFFDQLAIVLKLPHIFKNINDAYLCHGFDYERPAAVDSVRGAFFFIDRQNFRALSGGSEALLDERYFIWFEEVDFCRQVKEKGGEVWYSPVAACRDYVGQSFKQVKRGRTQQYFRESMIAYFRKWEPAWQARLLGIAWRLVGFFIR